MKKSLISITVVFTLLFISGSFSALFQGAKIIWQVFKHLSGCFYF
ncbi:MAG: hypothetical protein ACOX02_02255 [Acholeplasmatales bacterium]